jgi:hypothetical protein
MRPRLVLLLVVAFALGACAQGSAPANPPPAATSAPASAAAIPTRPPAADDLRFTITFAFDNRAVEPDIWTEGTFVTTGTIPRALIAGLTETRSEIGTTWPSSGTQRYGDYACTTPDECLEPCVGSYDGEWQDTPAVGVLDRSAGHVLFDALLHPDPTAADEQFRSADCPPQLGGGQAGFPPMHITVDGLDTGAPTYSIEAYEFDGSPPPPPGTTWKLEITPG